MHFFANATILIAIVCFFVMSFAVTLFWIRHPKP
jgi:hypothetical protein